MNDTVPQERVFLARHGFSQLMKPLPPPGRQAPRVYPTKQRPTAGLMPGMEIFDFTLGIPIWRNGANTGWVDATGSEA